MDSELPRIPRFTRAERLGWMAVVALAAVAAFAVWALMLRMPGASFEGTLPPLSPREEALKSELARDIDELATSIGERNVLHSEKLAEAARFVEDSLQHAGYQTREVGEELHGAPCPNVEAERVGASNEIVLVGAHYDSAIGTPGANDNASGVAALLALARSVRNGASRRTVRFVAFVNEEPPYFWTDRMGSVLYAGRAVERGDRIVAMLSLETMGYFTAEKGTQVYPFPMGLFYPDRGDFIGFIGDVSSRELVRSAVGTFRASTSFPSEGAALPGKTPGAGWSDHSSFWRYGIPAIMVTDTALYRYRQYHTADDVPRRVDTGSLARVVVGLERGIEALAR